MECIDMVANNVWAKQIEALIAGEYINAKSPHWVPLFRMIEEITGSNWAAALSQLVLNTGMVHTFVRGLVSLTST